MALCLLGSSQSVPMTAPPAELLDAAHGRSPAPRVLSAAPFLFFQQHRQETRRADKWAKMLHNWDHDGPSKKVGTTRPQKASVPLVLPPPDPDPKGLSLSRTSLLADPQPLEAQAGSGGSNGSGP